MTGPDVLGDATARWFHRTFAAPTPVQVDGLPVVAAGGHALLCAPTGSGKTLAAFLVALDRLVALDPEAPPGVRLLYVSPLKALAVDVERNLLAPLAGIAAARREAGLAVRDVVVDVRTGDTKAGDRARMARRPGDVRVTTPESLFLLLGSRKARESLRSVVTIIVDEIHVLAASKRGVHLAISLERLAHLTGRDPQRVGLSATQRPIERIAAFLGGPDRTVTCVEPSAGPSIACRIVVPVDDMERPATQQIGGGEGAFQRVGVRRSPAPAAGDVVTSHGMWPAIHPVLLDAIRTHRSTLVFVNSRLLCERLATRLDELHGAPLVRAHHGSLSHARRAEVEAELKAGRLPALVATSSLELGIDMGSIDLVVMVESPGSVARGLQRVGRAGHQVGATSEGLFVPRHRLDLLECCVVAERMAAGVIENTHPVVGGLDVLAQHVVAMTAVEPWRAEDLFRLARRTFALSQLDLRELHGLLGMLDGRFHAAASALRGRVAWDRTLDVVTARPGSGLVASTNAGAIPDRGMFTVHHGEGGPRVGELDEEMVYECRAGDVIQLGASAWRIDRIGVDRVLVSPAPGEPARVPFWKGDRPPRPVELGAALGQVLRWLEETPRERREAAVRDRFPVDLRGARNLVALVAEQEQASAVPTDRRVVIETSRDLMGDARVCILDPSGSRLTAPWAMLIDEALSAAGSTAQVQWTEDGIVVRVADGEALPERDLLIPAPEDLPGRLLRCLRGSALFAAAFRENASRALLLPRRPGPSRTPLWAARLRARDLAQVVLGIEDFPIVTETAREILADRFDLAELAVRLSDLRSGRVDIVECHAERPSPYARGLLDTMLAAFLYEPDTAPAERRALALRLDRHTLARVLGEGAEAALLPDDAVAAWLARARPAPRGPEDVLDLLRRFGDATVEEVAADPAWLHALHAAGRVLRRQVGGREAWIAAEDGAGMDEPDAAAWLSRVVRYAAGSGPFTPAALTRRWALPEGALDSSLDRALAEGRLTRAGDRWCHADLVRGVRNEALRAARAAVAPVPDDAVARFLLRWHGVGQGRRGPSALRDAVRRLAGVQLPLRVLEGDVLPSRLPDYHPRLLDSLVATGEFAWVGGGAGKDPLLTLLPRDGAGAWWSRPEESVDGVERAILDRLAQRGPAFLSDLVGSAASSAGAVTAALYRLMCAGLVTNDGLAPLRAGGRLGPAGRFSSTADLVATGDGRPTGEDAALAFLDRVGFVTRDMTHGPRGVDLWAELGRLERIGKVRRGNFFGTGVQFALPGAVDALRAVRDEAEGAVVVHALDPANAWGAHLSWPDGRLRRSAHSRLVLVAGRVTLAWEGRHLLVVDASGVADALPVLVARGSCRFTRIDGVSAVTHPLAGRLVDAGFRRVLDSLELPTAPR